MQIASDNVGCIFEIITDGIITDRLYLISDRSSVSGGSDCCSIYGSSDDSRDGQEEGSANFTGNNL